MPLVVRWYLRTALLYFMTGLLLGILLAAGQGLIFLPPDLSPVYLHVLVVGWISQLIMGVAIWMFPKFSLAQPRGSEPVNWIIYLALNSGLLLRVIGEPLNRLQPGSSWGWLLVISAALQWLAAVLFAANTWRRVKEK